MTTERGLRSRQMQIQVRNVDISYETAGTGHPFIWGHGLTSCRAEEDRPPTLIGWPRINSVSCVTRYDARGHGSSGYTTEPSEYAWAELARDQVTLIDALGIDRFIVGGASMGAATALHTALLAPDRVDALVLVIPPTAWESRAAQTDGYVQMADIIDSRGVELLISAGASIPPPDPFLADQQFKERSADRLRRADPIRLAGVFRGAALADLPPKDQVALIDKPTMILAWTGDPSHPVSTAEQLLELLPQAELSLASSGEELQTWTDRIADFLSRRR